jgi:hypothetical protein
MRANPVTSVSPYLALNSSNLDASTILAITYVNYSKTEVSSCFILIELPHVCHNFF